MTGPSLKDAKRDAREARTWAGRALGWLDERKGPIDYAKAYECARYARQEAESVEWQCRQLGNLDEVGAA